VSIKWKVAFLQIYVQKLQIYILVCAKVVLYYFYNNITTIKFIDLTFRSYETLLSKMKYTKYVIIVFLSLVFSFNVFAQTGVEKILDGKQNEEVLTPLTAEDVEKLFENRHYEEVIASLSKKDEVGELSLREYQMLSYAYGRTRQYSNGLVFARKMQNIALESNDTLNLLKAANLASGHFVDLNEIELGLEYDKIVNPFFREKDSVEYQKYCFKLGMLYYYNKDYQKAYETYNKITKPAYRGLTLFSTNYALTLIGLERWDEAIVYLKKSLQVSYSRGNTININKELLNIAYAHKKQGNWELAKIYLDSSKNSLTKETSLSFKKNLFQNYFDFYREQGRLNEAANTLSVIDDINQELFNKRLTQKLQALETSNKREFTLKKKVKIIDDKLVLSQKQKLWGAVVFLFIIIGLLSFLFLYKYRNIKAAHENVVTEQRLLRAQMNPHFIFNSLSVLQGMILNKEDKKAVKYVSKFSKLLRLILESSREKMVSIDEELTALGNYVDIQNMGRQVPFKYTLSLGKTLEDIELLIPPMLIQPFVENAIEHGFKGSIENAEITIAITFKDEKLLCEINDNGVGINSTTKKSLKSKNSLATKITSERLKIISKQYNVESNVIIQDRSIHNLSGTQVLLTLPYKIDENA